MKKTWRVGLKGIILVAGAIAGGLWGQDAQF